MCHIQAQSIAYVGATMSGSWVEFEYSKYGLWIIYKLYIVLRGMSGYCWVGDQTVGRASFGQDSDIIDRYMYRVYFAGYVNAAHVDSIFRINTGTVLNLFTCFLLQGGLLYIRNVHTDSRCYQLKLTPKLNGNMCGC